MARRTLAPSLVVVPLLLGLAADPARAQLIAIKTLPIADGDQFRIFPSANLGMGGLSIALADSLLDPFVNPAKGARVLRGARAARFGGAPTFYSLSRDAGGGQTLPLSALGRRGDYFGGLSLAIQEIERIGEERPPLPVPLFAADGSQVPVGTDRPSRQNHYAYAMAGRELGTRGLSFAGSVQWSRLTDVDGTELLYAGSQRLRQRGGALDLRLGMLKTWQDGQSFEAMLLHNRYAMTHDVTWADQLWDPDRRATLLRAREERNRDLTNSWGMHLAYTRPLSRDGWQMGVVATTNIMSHPHLPEYQIERVNVIPWDPGYSDAYDFGVGIARSQGLTTFGVDAIFEPIRSHTWGETPEPIATERGVTLPAGGKTTENWFRFRNGALRAGVSQDIVIDSATSRLRLQLGMALRSINYAMRQYDHVSDRTRRQRESWTEWTRTWGLAFQLTGVELRYVGLLNTGTGRPGIQPEFILDAASALSSTRNILSAPNGPLTLTGVKLTTHQISVSMPVR